MKFYLPDFDSRQGQWVKVLHGGKPHIGLTLDINTSDKLICVKCWFLLRVSTGSLSLKGIEFGIVSLICLGDQIMIQQWKDEVVCTNYKHLIHAYH